MSFFPVINSNLSPTHLATFVQEYYALTNNTKCNLLKAGINHTYLVKDDEKKYIFRVYSLNWRTKNEILEEINLLNLLKEHHISISYPITDKNKNYIQSINAPEGKRFGVMFSFAEGEKLLSFSEEGHFQIGVLMARIHQITQNLHLDRIEYTPKILLENPLQ